MTEFAKDPMLVIGGLAIFVIVVIFAGTWLASRIMLPLDESIGVEPIEEESDE